MTRGEGFGRWTVRLLALAGALLVVLGTFGWWLSTRVLEADGFADVAAKASQRVEVRDYVADQATLRLARTSNFVSAARPVVTDAIAAAMATPPVEDAIRDFVLRAHQQVFQARGVRRIDVNSQEAAVTIRSALQTINPSLSKKLPANVLDATASVSQSDAVDVMFRASRWVEDLYLPAFLLGVGLFILAMVKARERVRAIRTVGVTLAVAGGLLVGVGFATPAFSSVAGTADPLRGDAVAAFIEVLVGRLIGAGQAFLVVGLLLASGARPRRWRPARPGGPRPGLDRREAGPAPLALRRWPRADGPRAGDAHRAVVGVPLPAPRVWRSSRSTWASSSASAPAGSSSRTTAFRSCTSASWWGCSRRSWARRRSPRSSRSASWPATPASRRANPTDEGCNGYIELCAQPLNQIVWPASHNAMSSSAYNFLGAEHTITIPEQLNAGARFLMIDAYYGYEDNGLVRTNLAGGVNRDQLRKERGRRSGARTRPIGRAHGGRRHIGQETGRLLLSRPLRARRDPRQPGVPRPRRLPVTQSDRRRGDRRRGLRAAEGLEAGLGRGGPVQAGVDGRARSSSAGRHSTAWCDRSAARTRTHAASSS